MNKQFFSQKTTGYALINIILIVAVGLLLISNGISLYYLQYRPKQIMPEPVISNQENLAEDLTETESVPTTEQQDADKKEVIQPQAPDLTAGEISVDWYEWPAEVSAWSVFKADLVVEQAIDAYNNQTKSQYNKLTVSSTDFVKKYSIYEIGTVSEGVFQGDKFYVITAVPDGPSSHDSLYRVIIDQDKAIIISKYSDELWTGAIEKYLFSENNKITIANLEPSPEIAIPNSNLKLIKASQEPFILWQKLANPKKMFQYNGKDYVYKDKNRNCFIIRANDGTARDYNFDLKFLGKKSETELSSFVPYMLDIVWTDGVKNQEEYIYAQTGICGGYGCYNYVGYINDISKLEKIGSATKSNDTFYIPKNKASILDNTDKKSFNDILQEMYDSYYPGYDANTKDTKEKIPFETFIADHPIIFWQDPFGDFVEFQNAKYLPAVECGKPVIYLYPEVETDVLVSVKPTGGFSKTEPVYNNGWRVLAKPDGQLYNYADNQTYPYLFWEGYGLNYHKPNQGFVVAQLEVKKFLEEKLAKLGLIKKEYDEFIDFWLPKMQDYPYYFITFVPQTEFDQLAPLKVQPKPDTIIRVFMDYQGLNEWIDSTEPVIITPERNGFTVVEWGGAMRK